MTVDKIREKLKGQFLKAAEENWPLVLQEGRTIRGAYTRSLRDKMQPCLITPVRGPKDGK